jgi:ABC-type transporter Mla maintaining outer membrane lipid asymmetry ATPase subunit MlaF
MTEIIELKNVGFSAQDGYVIQDVTVGFVASKTTAIVGPSGGGKSTVLKLAAGLLVPDHGEVLYKGNNIAQMNRSENLDFRREGAFVDRKSVV